MMTSSNGYIFHVTGHFCEQFIGPRWIPRAKASGAELWCLFHMRLNKQLSKQSWGWSFEMLPHPLWRHSNKKIKCGHTIIKILGIWCRPGYKNAPSLIRWLPDRKLMCPFAMVGYHTHKLSFENTTFLCSYITIRPGHMIPQVYIYIYSIDTTKVVHKSDSVYCGPFYKHGLTLIPAWISNYIHY